MRKRIISQSVDKLTITDQDWLDVERIAQVELTSEDPAHPFESALRPDKESAWRASSPGEQTIRLLFYEPVSIKHIRLEFSEEQYARTQEFVLRWSSDDGQTYQEIARQQYNFSPPDTIREVEDYAVDLDRVTALELNIIPDISRSEVRASLSGLQLA